MDRQAVHTHQHVVSVDLKGNREEAKALRAGLVEFVGHVRAANVIADGRATSPSVRHSMMEKTRTLTAMSLFRGSFLNYEGSWVDARLGADSFFCVTVSVSHGSRRLNGQAILWWPHDATDFWWLKYSKLTGRLSGLRHVREADAEEALERRLDYLTSWKTKGTQT